MATIQRIVDGTRLEKPLVDLNVSLTNGGWGMATITRDMAERLNNTGFESKGSHIEGYVFVYFDESEVGDCDCPPNATRLYRYELVSNGSELVNPKLFISLPIGNSYPILHEGGPVKIGPDGNVYLMVGDVRSVPELGPAIKNKAVNYNDGEEPFGSAGILRFNLDGQPVTKEGILGDNYPLNLYYAYGIRNSFGFTFDPLTGNIWATENGPNYGDEINLVKPGFNSGWAMLMGFERLPNNGSYAGVSLPDNLVDFNGRGKYHSPEFVWQHPVGPTQLTFLNSDEFGKYQDDLLVGDYQGNIYHFRLNESRDKLILNASLADSVANDPQEAEQVKFGRGFRAITDMQIGLDGHLYILSADLENIYTGKVFRVVSDFQP